MSELQLSEEEWEKVEVLLVFLLPFKRCTSRFECNRSYTEIDYVFFAYDTMYNHIDDVKAKLMSGSGIGTLSCARYFLKSIEDMETILKRYYSKTQFPTVYGDGMILNPQTKLVIFNEDTWEDTTSEEYSNACRRRFIQEYDNPPNNPSHQIGNGNKRSFNAYQEDPNFQQVLAERSSKRRRNDYDRYIEIPNDPDIFSSLGWWRQNGRLYPDLSRMARDVLPVPASGCAVEREFSISGRMAIWQRNRLGARTISDSMMYKAALRKTRTPMLSPEITDESDDVDSLTIPEREGNVPEEWIQNWWLKKLEKRPIRHEIVEMFHVSDGESDLGGPEEDLYGDQINI